MWTFIEGAWKFIEGAGNFIESVGTITEGARQVGSYVSIDDRIETLKRKCEDLRFRAEDVKTELGNAESSSRVKRRKTVENWLTHVQNLRNQVDAALSQTRILERPQLANKVQNLTELAEEFLEQGKFPHGLTVNTPHDGGVDLLTKPLVGQAFQDNLEKTWGYLMEPEVVTIGIWGMGGVGKTTLVTHINNRARENRYIFSNVFWVTVSQNLDIPKLQDEFAKAVNLSFDNEQDERKRAAVLSSELKKRRCLFILDDVWHPIDLDRVGIPVQVNSCKLIITSRSLDVCLRMDCQEKIKVERLSEGEAWDLFRKNLGDLGSLSVEVSKVASPVARECAGLPLGIITVAKCMRGVNDAHEWRCALKELRESKDGRVEMEEEVFRVLKFSYNRLRDPKAQQSFLYCALYPEDWKIKRKELIQQLIDEGIVEAKESRQDQFDSGHTILNQLVRSSLLEETDNYDGDKCVKMHDLLRDMAINMKSNEFMVKSGMQLEELPGKQEWSEHVEIISLINNEIEEVAFPAGTSPRCPKLSTLLLSYNGYLNRIENSFFQHMPALQILDLTDCASIEELPDSVSNLKNLIALVLHGCWNLQKLPSLADLESMKRLDLGYTNITEVPHGLERLVRLTYLDLHDTRITEVPHGLKRLVRLTYLDLRAYTLHVFPTGILPQLLLLEFLTFRDWVEIKGEELKWLERLSTFEGRVIFDDVNDFKSYVMSRGAHKWPNGCHNFELNDTGKSISGEYVDAGDDHIYTVKVEGLNISKRAAQEEAIVDVKTMEALVKDVQYLKLKECFGAPNLCDISWLDNTTHDLNGFQLISCQSVQCLVPYSNSSPYFLQNLEVLTLEDLDNLEVLFELGRGENGVPSSSTLPLSLSPPPVVATNEGAFSCLKVLRLFDCNTIKILFLPSILPNLRNLEKIDVQYCFSLQEVIGETISEGETSTSIELEYALPNLKTLSLLYLPELKSICVETISCPSLCKITVGNCPRLKRMPLSKLPFQLKSICVPSFQFIKIHPKEWWESAEFDDPNAKELLKPYLRYF